MIIKDVFNKIKYFGPLNICLSFHSRSIILFANSRSPNSLFFRCITVQKERLNVFEIGIWHHLLFSKYAETFFISCLIFPALAKSCKELYDLYE